MHGFGHVDIPTTDLKKAKKFFGKIFGWTFEDVPEMKYALFHAGTRPNGGFYVVKKMPSKGQVNVYIEVEDIDATLKDIRKSRGKIMVKKTQIGTMGWFATFATPDGCYLSLWQAVPRQQSVVEETAK